MDEMTSRAPAVLKIGRGQKTKGIYSEPADKPRVMIG